MTATVEPRLGRVPPHLMDRLRALQDAELRRMGYSPTAAGGLVLFNIIRGLLAELGMLPEEGATAEEAATLLAMSATGALAWLRAMNERTLTPEEMAKARAYAPRLREAAALLDLLTVEEK